MFVGFNLAESLSLRLVFPTARLSQPEGNYSGLVNQGSQHFCSLGVSPPENVLSVIKRWAQARIRSPHFQATAPYMAKLPPKPLEKAARRRNIAE